MGLIFLLFLRFSVSSQIVYQHNFGTTAISGSPYIVSPDILNSNLSTSGWSTNVSGGFINYFGNGGNPSVALSLNNSSGTPSYTLSLNVNSGYQLDISSLSFWRQRSNSGATNFLVSINGGASVTTGTILTSGSNTGALSVSGYSGLTGNVSIVISLSGASGAGTFRLDDFTIIGLVTPIVSCTTPVSLFFQTQPTNVLQDAIMSPSVQVAAVCSDGTVATGYSGSVTLTVNAPGCGYVLQTVSFVNGIGTFSSIVFTRSPQINLSFTATSSGLTSVVSTTFNVNAPTGVPTITTIIQNNFDAIQDWSYIVGPDVIYGDTGSSPTPAVQGIGIVDVQNLNGNNVLRKSYSVDNASGEYACSNTVTFSNQSNLSSYNGIEFSFNVFSYATGSCGPPDGCGNDFGEDFNLDITTDGGITWITILNEYGWSSRLFPQSASPITSLSVTSPSGFPSLPLINGSSDTKSAFILSLSGISQFQFRFTAKNNRTNENWAIDNAKLVGISYAIGTPFNLPTVNTGADVWLCSGSSTQLNATVSSFQNPVTYAWSPNAFLSNTSISNPSTNSVTENQTYILMITDADNCFASDQVSVTVISPPSILAISPP